MAQIFVAHWEMFLGLVGKYWSKRLLASCSACILMLRLFYRFYHRHCLSRRFTAKQQQMKERMDKFRESLEPLSGSASELLPLTDLDLCELRKGLSEKKFSPIDLLHAFQLKALNIFDTGNSGICEFISEAESLFSKWSRLEKKSNSEQSRSPLYGIPVSVKETLNVKNYDVTAGLIKRCGMKSTEDCVLVEVLRRSGAIPFVLTSTSQALRTIDGINYVFGDVVNPYNRSRICGGSSCGEAVLLSQRGSPIGIASDIGGSIRIPAAFCGLASLKPTARRLSHLGMTNIAQYSVFGLQACPGPMGRKVDDLADVMRTFLTPIMFDLDHRVLPFTFDEVAYSGENKKRLDIGYYINLWDEGLVHVIPSVRDCVVQAVEAVAKAGHHIVKFKPPDPRKAYQLYIRSIFADGGRELRALLRHEPRGSQLRFLLTMLSLPNWMKTACDIFTRFAGVRPIANVSTLGGLRDVQAAFDLSIAVRQYQLAFQKAWGCLDAVICPVSAFPAPPSNAKAMFVTPSIVYTAIYNLVDYPAGTVPTGFVDRADVLDASRVAVQQRLDGDWYGSQVSALQRGSDGLPLSVQVVGKPFREETVLRVMRIIEVAVNTENKRAE